MSEQTDILAHLRTVHADLAAKREIAQAMRSRAEADLNDHDVQQWCLDRANAECAMLVAADALPTAIAEIERLRIDLAREEQKNARLIDERDRAEDGLARNLQALKELAE